MKRLLCQSPGICPNCHQPLESGQEAVTCSRCGTQYHRECLPAENECHYCRNAGQFVPRWGFSDIIMVYLGILIAGMLFSWIGSCVPRHFWQVLGNKDMSYFAVSYLVQFLTTVGLVYLFAVLLTHGQWKDLGVRRASRNDYLKYGILYGIGLLVLVVIFGQIIQHFQNHLPPQHYEEMLRSAGSLGGFLLILFMGAVLAPVSEELFYRGMIYPVLRRYMGPTGGALLAGLVFGLAHWDVWRTIPLAIGGAILCYIYEKTGSIAVSMVAHGMWNGLMSVIVYISMQQGFL